MTIFFFNHEIENPVLRAIIVMGAVVFAVFVVALVLIIVLPLAGIALTGAFLITGVVLIVVLVTIPFLSFFGILFSNRKKGSGVEKNRIVDVEPFRKVKVSGAITVDIVCGQPQLLTVTTDENLLESVKIAVEKEELSVSFARSVSSKIGIKLQIEMPEIRSLRLYGATRATITNVDSPELLIRGSGACKVKAGGKCSNMEVRFSGAGNLSAGELISEKMKIKLSGSAKAVVHATEKLTAKITGAGKVICHGNPSEVHKHISGAGKVEIVE
ncbi:MAG: DUF2807 domain-containing protein [Candidatus Sabulitectum sp.]|nr:DUF2807 domain-containing protein [Candidatus Sabulitectum sp.]